MHCLYGGYNLHWFSDALGLVIMFSNLHLPGAECFLFAFAAVPHSQEIIKPN